MGEMIAALTTITLGIVLWSLWTRRHTWRVKWETASTVQVALMAVGGLLGAKPPSVGSVINPYLHAVTHVWNLQYWLSHICMLGATCAIVYNAVSRLDQPGRCPDESFRSWFFKWIQIPTAAGTLIITALFCGSRVARRRYPNFGQQATAGAYVDAYWLVLSLLLFYLMFHGIRAGVDLWYRREGRDLLALHLLGCTFSIITLIMRIMLVFWWTQGANLVMVVCALGAMASFSVAALWSWKKRLRWFEPSRVEATSERQIGGDGGQTV